MSTTTNRRLANVVVIVNWIIFAIAALFFLIFIAGCFFFFDTISDMLNEHVQESGGTGDDANALKAAVTVVMIIVGIVFLIAILIELALNVLLTKAVNQSDRRKCNIWLVINLIFFILGAIGFIYKLYAVFAGEMGVLSFLVDLIFLVWLGISILIIKNLREDFTTTPHYGGVVYAKADNPA